MTVQRWRVVTQAGFFILFALAPVFDLFRFDLNVKHFYFLGMNWTLGLDDLMAGRGTAADAALNIVLRGFVPLAIVVGGGIWVSWKFGRLYCGWLCPHFSVVETINRVMRRAIGRPSLWDRKALPEREPDGTVIRADARWWVAVVPLALAFAFTWAVVLLTYLLPPAEVYGNLWRGEPTRNQALFIGVATAVLFAEFMLARHLFCRFGCAVGLFQSLAWMGNSKALVVSFERERARDCAGCEAACENVCPMRLKPRNIKRLMFACTQCGQCIEACDQVQQGNPRGSLLEWVSDEAAAAESGAERGGPARRGATAAVACPRAGG